jgi:hypothetical protein
MPETGERRQSCQNLQQASSILPHSNLTQTCSGLPLYYIREVTVALSTFNQCPLMGMVSRLRQYVHAKHDAARNDRVQEAEAYTVQITSIEQRAEMIRRCFLLVLISTQRGLRFALHGPPPPRPRFRVTARSNDLSWEDVVQHPLAEGHSWP